jgi:hypothetical protein
MRTAEIAMSSVTTTTLRWNRRGLVQEASRSAVWSLEVTLVLERDARDHGRASLYRCRNLSVEVAPRLMCPSAISATAGFALVVTLGSYFFDKAVGKLIPLSGMRDASSRLLRSGEVFTVRIVSSGISRPVPQRGISTEAAAAAAAARLSPAPSTSAGLSGPTAYSARC